MGGCVSSPESNKPKWTHNSPCHWISSEWAWSACSWIEKCFWFEADKCVRHPEVNQQGQTELATDGHRHFCVARLFQAQTLCFLICVGNQRILCT